MVALLTEEQRGVGGQTTKEQEETLGVMGVFLTVIVGLCVYPAVPFKYVW